MQFQSGAQALFNQFDQERQRETDMANLRTKFDSQMAGIQSQMQTQQSMYDSNMKNMQNTLMATMQPNNRESVLGIKSATTGASTENQAMARQGVKGTFSRSGMRIKKIQDKALNVT